MASIGSLRNLVWIGLAMVAWGASTLFPQEGSGIRKASFFSDHSGDGIDFVHNNGMAGDLLLPEVTGPGGALLDYDGDGDLDLYLVQGAPLGQHSSDFNPFGGDQLYRNDSFRDAKGHFQTRFTNVTQTSGIKATGYGMGVATGDYDNDGRVDIYVTNFGHNQMWRNNGNGTFSDATEATGTDDPRWSSSAAFLDYDNDGWLDLYVANYVVFDVVNPVKCYSPTSRRDYCGPQAFRPEPDRLFHNRGDGTFQDVTGESGVYKEFGPGLGVIGADFDGDGWIDIYVANDGAANQLWLNQKNGTFRNAALLAGVALNRMGKAEAGMGVDAGDIDGDGDEDLVVTHLRGETNTVYLNNGKGDFEDRSLETQLAAPSFPYTGFGVGWIDYDNDGNLDLLVLNGEVRLIPELAAKGDPFPLGQSNQLFHNLGGGRFEEIVGPALGVLAAVEVSRGAAFGDIDNDGDVDVAIFTDNGRPRLLVNEVGSMRNWIGFELISRQGRDGLGAKVRLTLDSGRLLVKRSHTDGSYCSASDPRVLFGLGANHAKSVEVVWPGGETETWSEPDLNGYHRLRQGTGNRVAP